MTTQQPKHYRDLQFVLRDKRKESGEKLADIARRTGFSLSYCSLIENGVQFGRQHVGRVAKGWGFKRAQDLLEVLQ